MNFNDFEAVYGQSDFKMNGYLQNVIDFVLTDKAILKGNFALRSGYINCDEFMSVSTNQGAVPDILKENTKPLAPVESGVIVIPIDQSLFQIRKITEDNLKTQEFPGFSFVELSQPKKNE